MESLKYIQLLGVKSVIKEDKMNIGDQVMLRDGTSKNLNKLRGAPIRVVKVLGKMTVISFLNKRYNLPTNDLLIIKCKDGARPADAQALYDSLRKVLKK